MVRWNKQHITAASFIGLMALPLLLLAAVQMVQWYLKQTPLQRLQTHEWHTITLKEAAVVWEKTGRELIIDGRYFDVVSSRQQGENLILTGHFDEEETGIAEWLKKAVHSEKTKQSLVQLVLLFQCFILFTTALPDPLLPELPAALGGLCFHKHNNPFLYPPAPPPWL